MDPSHPKPAPVNDPSSLPWPTNLSSQPVAPTPPSPPSPPPANFQEKTLPSSPPSGNNPPPPPQQPVSKALAVQSPDKKFPLLFATFLIIMTITGFSGSYLYFRTSGRAKQRLTNLPLITPPVEISDKSATSSAEQNPFAAADNENPFSGQSSYENPFGEDETDIGSEPYQNPFDNLE